MLSEAVRMVLLLVLLMIAHPVFAAEKTIAVEVIAKAPVEDVWRAWTTTDGVKSFFAPDANVELRVDGPFEIFFNPFAKPGEKGADGMRIIGFQENKMLSFTWNAPPHLPEARKQRSVVIVRLAREGDDTTRVTLHHVGWGEGGEWDKAYEYFSKAWPNVLKSLQTRFEKGPQDWTEWLEQLEKMTK
ncbi:MAG TPA: SRPBCC domain-containing protein [Chthoniobacterales bacterium]